MQRGPVRADDLTALDDQLMKVRNDLAHGDERYPSVESGQAAGEIVTVAVVDEWLVALDRIASPVDTVVAVDLSRPLGGRPW